MIDRLIDALNIEMDLSVEEIADTIWLALQIQPESGAIASVVEGEEEELEESDRPFLERDEEISESSFSQREERIKKVQKEAGIYPPTPAKPAVSVDMSLKIPDAPSLRSPLHLVRGLKPLMRRVSSGRVSVLDEAKTSQNIAETGVWLPVLKPTLEPWLDLELVVDESLSMHLWRRAIAEWVRLLRNYGIFRNVRVWGLLVEDGRVGIRRGIGGIGKNQRFRSPDELVDPTGRGLVLVVSDCISSFWREGKMVAVLDAWGKRQPMAIAQMLPRWLWERTSLGRGATVRLRGLSPGVANGALLSEAMSLWDTEGGIKVPVLTLEAERAAIWAQMLAGKGVWCSGVVFAREGWREISEEKGSDRLTAADRVQGFRVTASPMARKLAGLLASAPVITLPVVRLIREQCLPESQQVHVAEVFLGGLLKPLTEIDADTNPDLVCYDFIEGVRELLIESVPSSYVLDVVDKVSQFIARKLGLSLETFAAVLKNPQEFSDDRVIEEVRPFAMVTAKVLRCLGGEYARFAEELQEGFKIQLVDSKSESELEQETNNQVVELESESEDEQESPRQRSKIDEELKREVDFERNVEVRKKYVSQKFVLLKINQGDFGRGFDVTLEILSSNNLPFSEVKIQCELPPNIQIKEIYEDWSRTHRTISLLSLFEEIRARKISYEHRHSTKQLKSNLKTWLSSSTNPKFQRLRDTLSNYLDSSDEIIVFLQTHNEILKKLPWQEWDLFSDRFPKSEIVLSPPEISLIAQRKPRRGARNVKILSILGDFKGIDVEKERELIQNLPDTDVEFLIEPDRQKFSNRLWEKDWDILFFAGITRSRGESGIIHLNTKDYFPLEDLKNSLKKARDRGLQLAIFNSGEGLRLAEYLAELNIPQIIVMRESIPNKLAQLFLEYFLQAYSGGESLYLAVRQAKLRLEAIEKETPGATWIPIIYQASLDIPPTWQELVDGDPPTSLKEVDCIFEKYDSPGTGISIWDNARKFLGDYTASNISFQGIKLAFSVKINKLFFVTTWDEYIKIWETGRITPQQKQKILGRFSGLDRRFSSVAISPDNKIIAACTSSQIFVWRLGEDRPLYTFSKNLQINIDILGFEALAFSPDGRILAAGDAQNIKLLDVETGRENDELVGHSTKVTCVVFHPRDSRILASCSYDKTIRIWRIDTAKSIATLTGHIDEVFTLAFSPDGQLLVSGGKDNTIQLWPIYSGELPLVLRRHSDGITDLTFNPDGRTFISSSYDGTIREWTITGKHLYCMPQAHDRGVTSVSFSPDGETLISGGRDRKIKVWRRQN